MGGKEIFEWVKCRINKNILASYLKFSLPLNASEVVKNTIFSLLLNILPTILVVKRSNFLKVGTEAAYHPVEEYMKHVLEWFRKQKLTQPDIKTRVYVASDEPRVLSECRKKYPDVEFLGDQDVAKSAAVSSRYSDSSLRGVIQDIHLLSLTDYLVCTFSSQVLHEISNFNNFHQFIVK